MTAAAFDLRVFPGPEALSHAAADLVNSLVYNSQPGKKFTVALSGGSTPRPLYSILGSSPYRDAVPWQRVHFFWADERCVPPDHSESNYNMARETLLSRLTLPEDHIHRIRGEAGAVTAAALYEKELINFFGADETPRFDLILLGTGNDGHTASLFPGTAALEEKVRLVLPVHPESTGPDRVTLTLPVLNNAAHIIFLAAGSEKSGVVYDIVEQGNRKKYPAGMIHPIHGRLTWMVDREAGATLSRFAVSIR